MFNRIKGDRYAEVEFELLENPFEYMKAFFRCEFLKEENEIYFVSYNPPLDSDFLKVAKVQLYGWKMMIEGYAELAEGKENVMKSCGFYKRQSLPQTGYSMVDVYLDRNSDKALCRMYVMSKKNMALPIGKLYLK